MKIIKNINFRLINLVFLYTLCNLVYGQIATPNNATQPQPVAQASAATHPLSGLWKVTWVSSGTTNTLNIQQVQVVPGVINFSGFYRHDAQTLCPVNGYIADTLNGTITGGNETVQVPLNSVARFRVNCNGSEAWFETFGIPEGAYSFSGRARVSSVANNKTTTNFGAVLIGR